MNHFALFVWFPVILTIPGRLQTSMLLWTGLLIHQHCARRLVVNKGRQGEVV